VRFGVQLRLITHLGRQQYVDLLEQLSPAAIAKWAERWDLDPKPFI
jgi:hypothetical protein